MSNSGLDPFQCTLSERRHSPPAAMRGAVGCGSVHFAATMRSGASVVLKPRNNSQKGRGMISNVATGRAKIVPLPPSATSIRSNQYVCDNMNMSSWIEQEQSWLFYTGTFLLTSISSISRASAAFEPMILPNGLTATRRCRLSCCKVSGTSFSLK